KCPTLPCRYDRWDDLQLLICQPEHTPDVPGRHLRTESTVGYDVRDVHCAVFIYEVIDNFVPPGIFEVDIYIRHRHTFRIEKTFEQQVVFKRIYLCNIQKI